ncbi:MAG: hypothetical protein JNJ99_16840, partial [Crocinitomicaceae bacterium]|nr:hypothetical protein [Crocinitomicaceae bacterium]
MLLLFVLTHKFTDAQINPIDDCTGAPALTVNSTCVANNYTLPASFGNNGMIQASCSAGVGQNQEDGWYTFVATGTTTTIELTGNYAHTLAVFSGCPPTAGNELACNLVTAGNTATVTIPTTVGTTYYVQVHRKSGGAGQTMTGTICVYSPVAGTNDNPCSATVLTVGATCSYTNSTNAGATASSGVPAPGCASYSGGDVWFQVTVPASGNLIVDSNTGVVTDGGMALYSGTCGSVSLITCNDDGSSNGLMPM